MQILPMRSVSVLIALMMLAGAAWGAEEASIQALTAHHMMPRHPLTGTPKVDSTPDGNRLAHIDGCFGCHGEQLTGHIVFADRLGTQLVAPNLTRLVRHVTDGQLTAAIRYGIKPDGTSVIDMPSDQFIKSSGSDIAAIIAYIRSLPEKPDTAGSTRIGLGGQAMMTLGLLPVEAGLVGVSDRGPTRNPTLPIELGHYLTQAHCSVCHGDDLSGKTIEGSPDLRISIQHYSPITFAHFFKTGEGQIGHGTATMTKMIRSRFKYFTPAEVSAIYAYLKAGAQPN